MFVLTSGRLLQCRSHRRRQKMRERFLRWLIAGVPAAGANQYAQTASSSSKPGFEHALLSDNLHFTTPRLTVKLQLTPRIPPPQHRRDIHTPLLVCTRSIWLSCCTVGPELNLGPSWGSTNLVSAGCVHFDVSCRSVICATRCPWLHRRQQQQDAPALFVRKVEQSQCASSAPAV